jgi:hypothetical protein
MSFDNPVAEQLIRDAIARKAAEETILIPVVEKPDVPIFLTNPQEWLLFVMLRRNDCQLGGDEYVAVHPETHEVRFLGVWGD